jgi:Pyridoxamine 5'-phosphate oxidase
MAKIEGWRGRPTRARNSAGTRGDPAPDLRGGQGMISLTPDQVWRAISSASFAVICYATPTGEPRASGVGCTAAGRRLYVVTAPDSWKARQIRDGDRVAVTVLLRRGGLLSLLAPIPPATISFRARVTEHPAGSLDIESVSRKFASRLPQKRRAGCVLELIPEGTFLTYGVGVSLRAMMDPDAASVPHSPCDGVPTERAEPCVLARRRMKLLSAVRVQIRGLDLKIVDLKIAIFTAPGRPHWDRSWLCGNTFVHQPTPPPRASRATLRSQRSSPGALTSRSMTRSPSRRALRNVRIRSSGRCRGRKALARCGVLRA